VQAQPGWDRRGGSERARILLEAADLVEDHRAQLMALMVREAGKTLDNALGDVREAADFLRYYASETRAMFGGAMDLKSVTGERNSLSLHGRGVFACISPWNFPLAIFTGQVAAALAAGNAVVAKPAEQTPLTAFLAVRLLHLAGVPADVLHLLPGDGRVGARLVSDPRVSGIAFTGSNDTAWRIQKALAERRGPIIQFIAETGGVNAMLVDSSALAEQVVRDCVRSAFDSAGQRCSAARLLLVQEEVAPRIIDMLVGAMRELELGDPLDYATDVGPVIDEEAQTALEAHKLAMRRQARELVDLPVPEHCRAGTYVSPALYEIEDLRLLDKEVFGPILHVARFRREDLAEVCDAINGMGYGLTLGLHSRIAAVHKFIADRVKVGNLYINRNQIGAVVGSQPFGGEGLSGTGPKAGGPFTLPRYAVERVCSIDVTATGGNTELLAQAAGEESAAAAALPEDGAAA
jgi:RHH-type proline utilization regulon transcriptional repressor/proline dehydrogenase/delta 1-pyrroline-5-carboxylate dehydrogenase